MRNDLLFQCQVPLINLHETTFSDWLVSVCSLKIKFLHMVKLRSNSPSCRYLTVKRSAKIVYSIFWQLQLHFTCMVSLNYSLLWLNLILHYMKNVKIENNATIPNPLTAPTGLQWQRETTWCRWRVKDNGLCTVMSATKESSWERQDNPCPYLTSGIRCFAREIPAISHFVHFGK